MYALKDQALYSEKGRKVLAVSHGKTPTKRTAIATRGLPSTDSGQTHIDNFVSLGSNNYVQELDCQSGVD